MKNEKDPLPRLRAAGVKPITTDSTAYECVYKATRPETPNELKKYR